MLQLLKTNSTPTSMNRERGSRYNSEDVLFLTLTPKVPGTVVAEETRVQPLGQEDPPEKGMATHSSILLAWRIPSTEEPGGLQSMGSHRVGHDGGTDTQRMAKGGHGLSRNSTHSGKKL
ncbi:hypothetical protein R6Z07M_001929 [Ovis aries]